MTSQTRSTPSAAASVATFAAAWARAAGDRIRTLSVLGLAEAHLAALGVASMVFMSVLAALFALTTWGLLNALLVLGLTRMGLELWAVLLALSLTHSAAALVCWNRVQRLTSYLEFPETRRHLAAPTNAATNEA